MTPRSAEAFALRLVELGIELLPQLVDHLLEIRGQLAGELHAPVFDRMREREACGVEERTIEMRDGAKVAWHAAMNAAIERVADDRVADSAQMDTNLMGPAGMD